MSLLPSIAALRAELDAGRCNHLELIEQVLERAQSAAARHVFTLPMAEGARAAARDADARRQLGLPLHPLAGLPVTLKDLYDVAGHPTRAGAASRHDALPAPRDATAVARLRAAGAALVGKTSMTEFAFSGVGINPHTGTPANPADTAVARIPGGSSSGAAVSVALGLAVAGLGSDTGGSIRIPAALCGLVGFKSTQSRVPLDGVFPLSQTLDTACALARSVDDCLLVDAVLSGAPLQPAERPLAGRRLAVPAAVMFDQLEPAVAAAFDRALQVLSAAGAQVMDRPLAEFGEVSRLNAPGGFSAVEAYAVHRDALASRRALFDPRVAARLDLGAPVSAADYLDMQRHRRDWIARTGAALQDVDAVVCPTVPMQAPALAPLVADDAAFFRTNGLLLRNTFVVNYLDGCAFSLPCQGAGELPVGLMLAAPGGHDAVLASVARAVEAALRAQGLGL